MSNFPIILRHDAPVPEIPSSNTDHPICSQVSLKAMLLLLAEWGPRDIVRRTSHQIVASSRSALFHSALCFVIYSISLAFVLLSPSASGNVFFIGTRETRGREPDALSRRRTNFAGSERPGGIFPSASLSLATKKRTRIGQAGWRTCARTIYKIMMDEFCYFCCIACILIKCFPERYVGYARRARVLFTWSSDDFDARGVLFDVCVCLRVGVIL